MFGERGLKARVLTMTLSNMKPRYPTNFSSDSLTRFSRDQRLGP